MAGKKKINPDYENIPNHLSQRDLYIFFEKFKLLGGIEIDPNGTLEEFLIFFTPSGMVDVMPVTKKFSFNPRLNDDELRLKLKEFNESIMNHPSRIFYHPIWSKDAGGKKRDWREVLTILNNCHKAYVSKKNGDSNIDIATTLGLLKNAEDDKYRHTEQDWKSAEREVRRLLSHSEKLITAAKECFEKFLAVVMSPLPRDL